MIRLQREGSHDEALDAFLARKLEIDAMLQRLTTLSADQFGVDPEDVDWGHVGTLVQYAQLLRQVSDSAFREGEHAARKAGSHPRAPRHAGGRGLGLVGGRGSVPGQPEDATMTDFTTAQLATILSALAGKERSPPTRPPPCGRSPGTRRASAAAARRCSPSHPGCSRAGSMWPSGASS